jgi:hypothetical protein
MSWQKTGNRVHDDTCIAAESTHQVAAAGAAMTPAGAAAVRQADITSYRAVLASCRVNNNGSGAEQAISALKELGVGGS